jgi:hypothetical protein
LTKGNLNFQLATASVMDLIYIISLFEEIPLRLKIMVAVKKLQIKKP